MILLICYKGFLAAWMLVCIGKFDQISIRNSFIMLTKVCHSQLSFWGIANNSVNSNCSLWCLVFWAIKDWSKTQLVTLSERLRSELLLTSIVY